MSASVEVEIKWIPNKAAESSDEQPVLPASMPPELRSTETIYQLNSGTTHGRQVSFENDLEPIARPRVSTLTAILDQTISKNRQRVEIIVLCGVIVIMWCLMALPTIFYHLLEVQQQPALCMSLTVYTIYG